MTILQSGRILILVGLCVVGLARTGHTAPGDPDASFSSGRDLSEGQGLAVAVQKDGKSVVVGSSGTQMMITRYTTSGGLDTGFSGDGKILLQVGTYGQFEAVAVQPDGKIIAAGRTENGSPETNDIFVVRVQKSGAWDGSFSGNGKLLLDLAGGFDVGSALLIQPDGKIVVLGSSCANGRCEFAVLRMLANGELDPSFGGGGVVSTPFTSEPFVWDENMIFAGALQPDGKIVAAGVGLWYTEDREGVWQTARYNTDGSLDGTFDQNGVAFTIWESFVYGAHGLVLQTDGGFVTGGTYFDQLGDGGGTQMVVVKQKADGSIDETFGGGGPVFLHADIGCDPYTCVSAANGLTMDADGKILLAGERAPRSPGTDAGFLLVRVTSAGAVDPTFGEGGHQFTSFGGTAVARGVALQPKDGKAVLTGANNTFIGIARYHVEFCNGKNATIAGTAGSDVLMGTAGADVIFAGTGHDSINGLGGNDSLCGGAGNDTMNGGSGNDVLKGGKDDDHLDGGAGTDKCHGDLHVVGDTATASCEQQFTVP